MKVAVITPYFEEPTEVLRRAHESVLAQTHRCTHFLVADGVPNPEVDSWNARHMVVAGPHKDYGNTARGLGAMSALNLGFDAFAFLDADNWYAPEHVQSLVETCITKQVPVAFSDIQIVLSTGHHVDVQDAWAQSRLHVDTNAYFITAEAAFFLAVWAMIPPAVAAGGDQVVIDMMRRLGIKFAFTDRKTVFYVSRWRRHFARAGVKAPPDAREVDWKAVGSVYKGGWLSRRLNLKRNRVVRVARRPKHDPVQSEGADP